MLGLDKILNKAIKVVVEVIATPLTKAVIVCFQKSELPKYFKATTMVILQKTKKKDYSLLRSYRLIALKNTLEKLLEKIIIECI